MYKLPDLGFEFAALEPRIDARTMEIHYSKHHRGYVDKLNLALKNQPELARLPVEELLSRLDSVPEELRTAVRNNGGGHANHSFFWRVLQPGGGQEPGEELLQVIKRDFGGLKQMRERFTAAALGRFGSGWAWLSVDSAGKLRVSSSPNQDSPLLDGEVPVLGLDVWEHAYYLQYQNRRAEYVEAFWQVVNWQVATENYINIQKAKKW